LDCAIKFALLAAAGAVCHILVLCWVKGT